MTDILRYIQAFFPHLLLPRGRRRRTKTGNQPKLHELLRYPRGYFGGRFVQFSDGTVMEARSDGWRKVQK